MRSVLFHQLAPIQNEGVSCFRFGNNCCREGLPDPVLQPRRHHRRGLPGQQLPSHEHLASPAARSSDVSLETALRFHEPILEAMPEAFIAGASRAVAKGES